MNCIHLAVKDHGSSWSSQRLMCSGGHDVTGIKRGRHALGSYQTTDMGHVSQHVGTMLIEKSGKVYKTENILFQEGAFTL